MSAEPAGIEAGPYIGSLSQTGFVESLAFENGPARGTRLIRVANGGGIEFDLLPDRALDIGRLTADGVPVAWISPPGTTSPWAYEPEGHGWLRTFGGGLLATCGLDTYGSPGADGDELLGQHGRIGASPAVVTRQEIDGEGVIVQAHARQARVLGENLVLHRTVRSPWKSRSVTVTDRVRNEGFAPAPHMILYHCNFGWPLLAPTASLRIASDEVEPRDPDAAQGLAEWDRIPEPTPGWREQVFTHRLRHSAEPAAVLRNEAIGLEARMSFDSGRLPCLYQWKMTGEGHYVMGLEPSNCPGVHGRAATREAGELPSLAPGETAEYEITFTFSRL